MPDARNPSCVKSVPYISDTRRRWESWHGTACGQTHGLPCPCIRAEAPGWPCWQGRIAWWFSARKYQWCPCRRSSRGSSPRAWLRCPRCSSRCSCTTCATPHGRHHNCLPRHSYTPDRCRSPQQQCTHGAPPQYRHPMKSSWLLSIRQASCSPRAARQSGWKQTSAMEHRLPHAAHVSPPSRNACALPWWFLQ